LHCGTGCQQGFGTCGNPLTPLPFPGFIPGASNPTTTTQYPISTNGRCGPVYGTRCPIAPFGQAKICCSDIGRCGSGIEFCGLTSWACKTSYGECGGPIPNPPIGSYPALDPKKIANVVTSCVQPGMFALTFDDGVFEPTDQLLDYLELQGIKATFFINAYKKGDFTVEPYRSVLLRMHKLGHHIGSHTYDHLNLSQLNLDGIYGQMYRNDVAFRQVLGFSPVYMRPPFGATNSNVLTALGSWGYKVIWINLSNSDTAYVTDPDPLARMRAKFDPLFLNSNPSTDSFISLQHDTLRSTVELWVPYVIQAVKQKGYRFVTVAECLGDTTNLYR
jgi:peptidoglycan/xylan/chitin deacetylase (PgdA/CDA1 family)